jgi:hypothetical protein
MSIKKLYRNWTVHNLISHPLMEMTYLVIRPFSKEVAEKWSDKIHEVTIPEED